MATLPGANRVIKSILTRSFLPVKDSSLSYRLNTRSLCVPFTQTCSFSAVPRFSLRPSGLEVDPPPSSSLSELTDDDYVPFKKDENSTEGSTAAPTARLSIHGGTQSTTWDLTSHMSLDQQSGTSIVERADEFEPEIELREHVKVGVDSIQQLLGASFGGSHHRSRGDASEEQYPTQLHNSPRNAALDGGDAVMELSEENVDAIASEISSAQSALDVERPIERGVNRPSARVARGDPAQAKRPSSMEHTTSQKPSETQSKEWKPPPRENWQIQKAALQRKFGDAHWQPHKRLSPDALDGIRALHAQYPGKYTTPVLADHFKVSPEAIRRILKSKWRPNEEEVEERRGRWIKRGEKIWGQMAEQGIKAPKKWRAMGITRRPKHDDGGTWEPKPITHKRTSNVPRPSRARPRKSLTRDEEPDWSPEAESTPLADRIL
ncbi:MAG: Required for respiratory growth protein 9 mitochondrial [Peltula sp. TS41687]|nr:MAG: Required for respiratory growth protein 9 mitochondrial [Peltula sp. TS41687]